MLPMEACAVAGLLTALVETQGSVAFTVRPTWALNV